MFGKYAVIFQVIGGSLKIIPVAAWDEIHIFLTSFTKIRWPLNISLQLLILWQIYMILVAFIGGYGSSIVFYRYGLVFVSLFLLRNYYRRLLSEGTSNAFIIVGFSYIIICSMLYFLGFYLKLPVAWWQEWLWVGTTYSAYVIYIIVALSIILSNSLKVRFSLFVLAYLAAINMDSRLTIMLITSLVPFIGFGLVKRKKVGLTSAKILQNLTYFIFTVIIAYNVFANKEMIENQFLQVDKTIQELLSEDQNDRDGDRKNNIRAITSLAEDDTLNFIIGTGLTSHQHELSAYLPTGYNGKVRPTGIAAVVFDGGVVYFLIIVLCAASSFLKVYKYARLRLIPLWIFILWATVIFNSVTILFVVNTTDLMLWWAVILSGAILTKNQIIKL